MMLPAVLVMFAMLSVVSAENQTRTATVAFAAGNEQVVSLRAGEILKFPKIYTNFGNAYNSQTGVFTATKTALYVFHFTMLTAYSSKVLLKLHHNDRPQVSVYGYVPKTYVMGGNSIVLRLKSGDRVYIKAEVSSSVFGITDRAYMTFVGYQISL